MRIQFGDYEIEIKARLTRYDEEIRFNKHDTMSVLNKISIYANESGIHMCEKGAYAIGDEAKNIGEEIYNQLATKGLYR